MIGNKKEIINYLIDQPDDKEFEIKEKRKKRSINSNNYCWQLISEIAKYMKTSKEEIYEIMLQRYGTLETQDGEVVEILSKKELESNENLHIKFIGIKDGIYRYLLIKGSSQYDSKEMSEFVDGVVSEAIEIGIETRTPEEIQSLKDNWK